VVPAKRREFMDVLNRLNLLEVELNAALRR
jgi:hypothetical protein